MHSACLDGVFRGDNKELHAIDLSKAKNRHKTEKSNC